MATTLDRPTHAADVSSTSTSRAGKVFAIVRIGLGWIFLWAFLDKFFGLGNTTPSDKSWLFGTGNGSPTKGFLSAAAGPFGSFYQGIAGAGWANWLFMLGLLGIGVGLMTGLAFRLSAICGIVMLVMMWSASLPIKNNPFLDDHIIYSLTLLGMIFLGSGHVWGLGSWWDRLVGDKVPFLK